MSFVRSFAKRNRATKRPATRGKSLRLHFEMLEDRSMLAGFAEIDKLTASDAAEGDGFGIAVAASGDTVVVGAVRSDGAVSDSGSAYVYRFDGTTWIQLAKLTASDAAADDQFGISVAISGDTVVVGAFRDDDAGSSSGSAYVFREPVTGWDGAINEDVKLTASDAAADDQFGFSVAISGDTVVVGAQLDDDAGSSSGSAYVFREPVTGWDGAINEDAKLTASDATIFEFFGESVAISGDTVVVGAFDSAYVFREPVTGWDGAINEDAKLTASDAAGGDFFGFSVAISGDTVVVGAFADDDAGSSSGSAYVFREPVTGWDGAINEDAKLTASDAATDDNFGVSVAISGDTVVVGALFDDDAVSSSGSAYVFREPVTGWDGAINEDAKLTASDAAADDFFGFRVAVSGDTVVVGSYQDDDAGSSSGSAYVFGPDEVAPDEVAPETIIDSATDGDGTAVADSDSTLSDSITVTFTGTDNVAVASFECSLDGAPFAPCVTDISYSDLSLGNHTFQVQAIDSAGNIDPTPAIFTWSVVTAEEATENLLTEVENLGLTNNVGNSLTGKLEAAVKQLGGDMPQTGGLIALLNAFISGVERWFSKGEISTMDRDDLVAGAEAILSSLSNG